ncbi:MAG TPA: hypothetical protein VMM93_11985 [Vicinamibacterales bacterium]|nr:hypothetical protein [Vicinamibacterales bacterium]
MTRRVVATGVGLALVAVLTAWALVGPREERLALDLVADLATATQVPGEYTVEDLELGGRTRRALIVGDTGRFIWKVTVPERAWLRVSLGQHPDAHTIEGDGNLFIVGAWDEVIWDELVTFVVNPFHTPEDRGWHDIAMDLSKYAGRTIELRFVLRQRESTTGDRPAWGDPRIVVR